MKTLNKISLVLLTVLVGILAFQTGDAIGAEHYVSVMLGGLGCLSFFLAAVLLTKETICE